MCVWGGGGGGTVCRDEGSCSGELGMTDEGRRELVGSGIRDGDDCRVCFGDIRSNKERCRL